MLPEIQLLRAEEELQEAIWRWHPHIITDDTAKIPTGEDIGKLLEKVERLKTNENNLYRYG